jgi:hypothetical protein
MKELLANFALKPLTTFPIIAVSSTIMPKSLHCVVKEKQSVYLYLVAQRGPAPHLSVIESGHLDGSLVATLPESYQFRTLKIVLLATLRKS